MTSAAPTPNHPNHPNPSQQSALPHTNPTSPPNKRDLKSWWKGFKLPSKHQEANETRSQGIFGVPLRQSITYANVAISLVDENGQSYIYGYVPIVVAKCGVFLKEKATGIEGIFRLSGSEKRIKELKTIFDSPDRYGKGLVWDGYTVHDAANVLRRYLNDLPEPVVPLDLYEKFRDPLRGATKQAVGDAEGPQFVDNFDEKSAIATYQRLITELPPLNRQLLLYILDLLAVFAAKADENRMNSQNLAAIFQPGMLSHPAHAMAPEEYRLNQCVIIFLIENQDHFLIGMQGTAADEKTVKEVESGPTPVPITPTSKRHSGVRRSASNASAGAESVRRDGMVRRNRSVSSRNSKQDGSTTPNSPALATTPTGGLGRSNTVPSKKSPALAGGKFKKADSPGHHRTSAYLEPLTQAYPGESTHEPSSTLSPAAAGGLVPSPDPSTTGRSQERLLEVPHETSTPHKERNLQSLFQRSPTDQSDKRQPNKLKKKRLPGSLNPSAQSSSTSLPQSHPSGVSPNVEIANPMDSIPVSVPENEPLPVSATLPHQNSDVSSEPTPRASQAPPNNNSLRPEHASKAKSPPASISSFNEGSDLDQSGEDQITAPSDQPEKEKKRRWRLSRAKRDDAGSSEGGLTSPRLHLGSNDHGDVSTSSIGSGGYRPRKSFTGESSEQAAINAEGLPGSEAGRESKEETKGPIGWIRNKYREAKENAEHRRNKSPPADRLTPAASLLSSRGKSLDIKRETREEEKEPLPPPPPAPAVVAAPPSQEPQQQQQQQPPPPPTPQQPPAQQPPQEPEVQQQPPPAPEQQTEQKVDVPKQE